MLRLAHTTPNRVRYLCDRERHLICVPYSIEGLHRMAAELGVGCHWFHGGRLPHYDIPKRRQVEIEARCEVIDSREIVVTILEGLSLTRGPDAAANILQDYRDPVRRRRRMPTHDETMRRLRKLGVIP